MTSPSHDDTNEEEECPICAQKMIFPTQTPCKHTFCFTCIKGVALNPMGASCPMCRGPIDRSVLDHPVQKYNLLMHDPDAPSSSSSKKTQKRNATSGDTAESSADGSQTKKERKEKVDDEEDEPDVAVPGQQQQKLMRHFWVYSGLNGWWRFDPRVEKELEDAAEKNKSKIETVLVGTTYTIDLQQLVQYPKNGHGNKKRDIRRVSEEEFKRLPIKGIAGVLLDRH